VRRRQILLILLAALACVTTPLGGRPGIDLVISSFSWEASRAGVYCDGARIGSVNGLEMTMTTVKHIYLTSSCRAITLHVIGLATGGTISSLRPVTEGECVRAEIGQRMVVIWQSGCVQPTDRVRR